MPRLCFTFVAALCATAISALADEPVTAWAADAIAVDAADGLHVVVGTATLRCNPDWRTRWRRTDSRRPAMRT